MGCPCQRLGESCPGLRSVGMGCPCQRLGEGCPGVRSVGMGMSLSEVGGGLSWSEISGYGGVLVRGWGRAVLDQQYVGVLTWDQGVGVLV